MSIYAQCPVCAHVLRPRSVDPESCWKSLRQHVSAKARECVYHQQLRENIFHHPARATCAVVSCRQIFYSVKDACIHMCSATDEAHMSFREQASTGADVRRAHARVVRETHIVSAGLYAAAKSGRAEEVRMHLLSGIDPNVGGEDGFTPLMTASEAGHEPVVDLLLGHNSCNINARNSYGQSALCLAAISGQVLVVLRLLQDERVDVECVSGGLSIAEKTRRAGFTELANILASAARQSQVANIMHAVMEGFASGDFDSITKRIEMLSARLAVARGRENTENPAIADDRLCSVCLSQPIEMIVVPCFHACLCTQCAGSGLPGTQHRPQFRECPICRGRVEKVNRVFFP